MKAAIVVLMICTLGLGGGLLWRHTQAIKQQDTDFRVKAELTNQLEMTKGKLDELEQLSMVLQTNLTVKSYELSSTSNNLMKVAADLEKTRKEAQAAADAARAEMAKRDQRIADLENQNDALDKQAIDLKSAISGLEKSIVDTEKKLAASEGDREFLLKELKRLQAEKAELERQFNDLSVLRAQVSKLKEELSIARRLEWIRMGIYGMQNQKGAEKLMQAAASPTSPTPFNLNVELKQDGSATIISGQTNAAPKAASK
jgi:chromosome segregation ATPase